MKSNRRVLVSWITEAEGGLLVLEADVFRGGCKYGELLPEPGLMGDIADPGPLLPGVSSPFIDMFLAAAESMRGNVGLRG